MAKSKIERKINKRIRDFNKDLKADVFGDRFWVRQYQKATVDGMLYFLYELCDREDPKRNYLVPGWFNQYEMLHFYKIWEEMNDFIIKSNFWSIYHNDPDRYKKDMDVYKLKGEREVA